MKNCPKALENAFIVALCGNPNVGKSTLFNSLTGLNQHTGNWSGKTVELAYGELKGAKNTTLVDLPGTYSLDPQSSEERITRDFIENEPSCVVIVADAGSLQRNLILALNVLKITRRAVLCINLVQHAQRRGITIDSQALERELGISVVKVDARKKKTLAPLADAIMNIGQGQGECGASLTSFLNDKMDVQQAARAIASLVTLGTPKERSFKADKILCDKRLAFPIMFCLLCLIFWITLWGANYPTNLLAALFNTLEQHLYKALAYLQIPKALNDCITQGIFRISGWVVAVMLPPMAIFFPLFSLLEDLGFLPRIAFNLDKPFQKCRACGKQALTMCMGFGCNAAAIVGTRIIDSPRERLIAILTNNFVPCNGRFPLLIALISAFFTSNNGALSSLTAAAILTGVVALGIGATFATSYFLSCTFLKGASSTCALELPPFRTPRILHTLVRAAKDRTLKILIRAVIVAAPAGLVIFVMGNVNIDGSTLLTHFANFLNPFALFLGIDGFILAAFLLALPANEIVLPLIIMGYSSSETLNQDLSQMPSMLAANGWNALTALNVIIICLMHFPCSTALLTIKKESGNTKWAVLAAVLPTILGIMLCFITTLLYNLIF